MLNEGAYENVRGEITRCDCPFEKAILSTCCACSLARRHHIAEREAVSCSAAPAHETCRKLHDLLREKALFALKLPYHQEKLPHAKEMKIQCGGLMGMALMVDRLDIDRPFVRDVHALVEQATANSGSLETLPYSEIVKSIAAFEGRHRHQ